MYNLPEPLCGEHKRGCDLLSSNHDFLAIDDVDSSWEVFDTAIDALTLQSVDALCLVRVEEHLFDCRRLLLGEISRVGICHRHI